MRVITEYGTDIPYDGMVFKVGRYTKHDGGAESTQYIVQATSIHFDSGNYDVATYGAEEVAYATIRTIARMASYTNLIVFNKDGAIEQVV